MWYKKPSRIANLSRSIFSLPFRVPFAAVIIVLHSFKGPLWRQIRGLGLAYHYSMSVDPASGKLTFVLMKSTHIFAAFQKGKQIVVRHFHS